MAAVILAKFLAQQRILSAAGMKSNWLSFFLLPMSEFIVFFAWTIGWRNQAVSWRGETYSFSGTTPNGVSINQFNNAYYNCDLVNPGPIAAIPLPASSGGPLNIPDVFVGERGLGTVPCLGVPSAGSFGNNITAYTVNNE